MVRKLLPSSLCVALAIAASATAAEAGRANAARAPSLHPADGGAGWYARFSHSLPTDPRFFPIAVWFESVVSTDDAATDKAAGLNTYVELTANSSLALLRRAGMHAIHSNHRSDDVGTETTGWLLEDEVDMWGGPGDASWLGNWPGEGDICFPSSQPCGYTIMSTLLSQKPGDGRMRYANYGKGVAFWETDAEAARFVNEFQDLQSADTYWFTDDHICGTSEGGAALGVVKANGCHVAANYGWTVRRLRKLVSPVGSKPVWAFVEVGHPFSEDHFPTITPREVRAAVWHSLIAGARGIIYFNHSFGGPCETQHALRDPCYASIRRVVTTTNRRIRKLAPVLNGPTVTSGWSKRAGTKAMVKWAAGHFYVFAGSAGSAVKGRFSLPCVGAARATVLFEDRSIRVKRGTFRDRFRDGNAIRVYRIDGGSSCGLRPRNTIVE